MPAWLTLTHDYPKFAPNCLNCIEHSPDVGGEQYSGHCRMTNKYTVSTMLNRWFGGATHPFG
jgi:hypothetical protein